MKHVAALVLVLTVTVSTVARADTPIAASTAAQCRAGLERSYAIVGASKDEALKKASLAKPVAESIATCAADRWPADVTACLAGASSVDEVFHGCYALPFRRTALVIGRRFSIDRYDVAKTAKPPIYQQSGDYLEISKDCGVLYVKTNPADGMFVLCEGKTRGPLMLPDEIKEVFATFSANETNRHNIVMSLIRRLPSGRFGGNWKVCDGYGNCHVE